MYPILCFLNLMQFVFLIFEALESQRSALDSYLKIDSFGSPITIVNKKLMNTSRKLHNICLVVLRNHHTFNSRNVVYNMDATIGRSDPVWAHMIQSAQYKSMCGHEKA